MSRYISPIEIPPYDKSKSFEENKRATIEALETYAESQRLQLRRVWKAKNEANS